MALHFQRARERERGPKYLLLAAEQAVERSAYREAVEHLSAALALLEERPASSERNAVELRIRCRLAPALVATRGWADSGVEDHYLRAHELAEGIGDSTFTLQTLLGLATMYEFRGEYELAERVARERIVLHPGSTRAQTLESQEILACSFMHQGRFQESVRHSEEALAQFDQGEMKDLSPEPVVLLVQAHGWMSLALHFTGRADDALGLSQRAVGLATDYGNELARASAHVQAAFLRFHRRERDDCYEHARIAESIGSAFRFPFHAACARILLGWAGSNVDDFAGTVREIRAGIGTSEAIGAKMDLPLFHAILADTLLHRGHLEPALQAIDEGIAILNRGRTFFYAPELYRLRGQILLALGDERREEALDEIQRALHLAVQQECPLFALRAAATLTSIAPGKWKETLRTIVETFHQGLDSLDLREALQWGQV